MQNNNADYANYIGIVNKIRVSTPDFEPGRFVIFSDFYKTLNGEDKSSEIIKYEMSYDKKWIFFVMENHTLECYEVDGVISGHLGYDNEYILKAASKSVIKL